MAKMPSRTLAHSNRLKKVCGPPVSPLLPLHAFPLGEDAMKHPPGLPRGAVPSTGDPPVVIAALHVCL